MSINTALPRGSFGVELSKIDDGSLTADQVADSLAHISRLVDSSARSDEDFATPLGETSFRTLTGLRQFLKVASDDNIGLSIEAGGIRVTLTQSEVRSAFDRVNEAKTEKSIVTIAGILRGILLESWKFDFLRQQDSAGARTLVLR